MNALPKEQIPLPTREEAEEILGPFRKELRQAIRSATDDYFGDLYAKVRHILSPRTQSNIIHDHIIYHVRQLLAGRSGVRMFPQRGIFTMAVAAADFRFKKLDRKLRSSNVRTNQQSKYSLQLRLAGFNDLPRFTAGYTLDHLRAAVDKITVTLQVGRKVLYQLPLGEPSGQEVLPFPAPMPATPAASPKRVRAKPSITKSEQNKE